jgi:hypothetical protein
VENSKVNEQCPGLGLHAANYVSSFQDPNKRAKHTSDSGEAI